MFFKRLLITTMIAMTAVSVAYAAGKTNLTTKSTTVMEDAKTMKTCPFDTIFVQGEPNPYGQFFTGQTYLNMLNPKEEIWNLPIGNVTFEPGARTNWHKHDGGQILLVLAGEGRYQEEGKPAQHLKKGDIVKIPPNAKHWHGAAPDSWFVHISLEPNAEVNKTTWLEAVTDKQYLGE